MNLHDFCFCRVSFGNIHLVMELDFEFELSKGKQNSRKLERH